MERHLGRAAMSGVLAGLIGAACMSMIAVLGAAIAGRGWYTPLELVGGLATGSPARLEAGLQVQTALAGLVLHFAIGAVWGLLFGVLVGYLMDDILPNEGIWLGAFYGVLVWAIDVFVLMPRIDPAASRAIPLWFGAFVHLSYGGVVGLTFHRFRARPALNVAT
jgi:hypothetical protein